MRHVTLCLRLARRFAHFLREEGLRPTLRRSLAWLRRNRLQPAPTGAVGPGIGWDVQSFWTESARKSAFRIATPPRLTQRRKVAMIGDLNLPQCRKYRVEQPVELLREAGTDYAFSHFQDLPRCMDILQDATHLFLYRLRSGPEVTRHLYEARRLRLPILYDIDDPLFSVPAYAGYGNMAILPPELQQHFIREAPFYADIMNQADVISVSTPALQEHARSFTPRPVFLRRNFADEATLAAPRPDGRRDRAGFRICLASGSRGHEADFAVIARDVARFLARDRGRRLVILGHFDRALLPEEILPQIETHPFTDYRSYLEQLATCDLALMPLADDLFNRCKSGVRVIDAASVAVPSLVGTVSDMAAHVTDGVTGRVIGPGASWAQALEDMATTPGLAAEMGRTARRELEHHWSARLDNPVVDPELMRWIAA